MDILSPHHTQRMLSLARRAGHVARQAALAAGVMLFAGAAAAPSLEYPIKATFLDKFGDFVAWPAEPAPSPTFNICVFGDDPFGPLIDQTLQGLSLGGRPVALARVHDTDSAARCHIVYIGRSGDTAAALAALHGKPVLTVTDAATWNGPPRGIIHFVLADNRVRFIIDDAAAATSGLAISSKLLAIAISVNPRPKASSP